MSRAGQPLALANEAYAEQTGWRKNSELIDALPYIDTLEQGDKEAVMKLIGEEVKRMDKKPADYLNELPPIPPSRLENDELVQAELKRVAAGESLAALDLQRYNLNPPPASQRGDPAAWQAALDNAYAQLEHQHNRLLNLELLLKFGPNTWRAHNDALSSLVARLQYKVAVTRGEINELNRERKLQQIAAGEELRALEAEYLGLVAKNAELEAICKKIEAEAAGLGANVDELSSKEGEDAQ